MPITNGNRPIVDLKRWDFCNPAPSSGAAGTQMSLNFHKEQIALFVAGTTTAYLYFADEDGYVQIASPGTTAVGAGAGLAAVPWSTGSTIGAAGLNPTAGTSTTITTNQTLARNLAGYQIQILEGPAAGDFRTISSNTTGANSVITVTSAFSSTPTTGSLFRLLTPRWILVGSGAITSSTVRIYDYATNTWTGASQTNLPATIATDSAMTSTSQYANLAYNPIVTGTSTGSNTSTTLNNTGKAWATNQWTNMQIRITGGTGAGQIRSISSNTGTAITVSSAWTTTPDNTSTYAIEGNDDHVYYVGSANAQMYRYSLSANTWTAVGTSRAGNCGAGVSITYFPKTGDAVWGNENAIIDGRRLYSFRGGASANLDYFDIASSAWTAVTYAPGTETFTAGSMYADDSDGVYITKDATGRWFKFLPVLNEMIGWGVTAYTQGTATAGNRAFVVRYIDGATTLKYVYFNLNSSNIMLRQMDI